MSQPAEGGGGPVTGSSIFVLFGPGGAGKGTIAARLVAEDPGLWLSRSWTTRARRPDDAPDAYVFVDRATFESHAADGGFIEWAEFLGNLYGTPVPEDVPGRDILLEIDLQGAEQIRRLRPDATLILLVPPSPEVQEQRLRARGDDEEHVRLRLAEGAEEVRIGRLLADEVVVNHEIPQATRDVAGIVDRYRARARVRRGPPSAPSDPAPTGVAPVPDPDRHTKDS